MFFSEVAYIFLLRAITFKVLYLHICILVTKSFCCLFPPGKTADALLSDLNGNEELKHNIAEFCEELEEYHNDQFDSWSREMLHMIDTEELRYDFIYPNIDEMTFICHIF